MNEILKILLETEYVLLRRTRTRTKQEVVFILVLLLVVNSLSFLRVNEKRVSRVAEKKDTGERKCRKHVSPFPLSLLSGSY